MKKLIIMALVLVSMTTYAQENVKNDTIVFTKPKVSRTTICYSTGKYVTLVTRRGPEEVFTNGKSYWVNRISKEGKAYKCYLTKEQKEVFINTYMK